jgi:DNA replication licensing factor MCM2
LNESLPPLVRILLTHTAMFICVCVLVVAPSVYGCTVAKTAVAMSLFGGVTHESRGHRIRGTINCLLLGDPGTAKSQLLKWASTMVPRAIYTTGKGASQAGLTAYVEKHRGDGDWTLHGGAMVLADESICFIDEFDKSNEKVFLLLV